MAPFVRILLTIALCLGIVIPKVGSAVQMLVLGELQTVVLCTGDGMVTIQIDAEGNPVETHDEAEPAPCVLGHIILAGPAYLPLWQVLARDHAQSAGLFEQTPRTEPPFRLRKPARAPPLLTV